MTKLRGLVDVCSREPASNFKSLTQLLAIGPQAGENEVKLGAFSSAGHRRRRRIRRHRRHLGWAALRAGELR